jgi:DNA polymerase kappa
MEKEDINYTKEAHMYNFTHEKAGMEGLDRAKIDQIIHEASVGSEFYKKQQEQALRIEQKVKSIKNEILVHANKGPDYIELINEQIHKKINEIELERILTETWIHIDMDMFYASVEIRDDPSLANKPVAVGGNSMITTANYIARRFGVRSAMPGFIGKKLCENLVFVKPNFHKYNIEGEKIREIFREFDPDFESMGLDEGNLRVTDYLIQANMNNDEGRQQLAQIIRKKIFDKTSLCASAGIGCNKLLAKIATDLGKPDGQYYVPFDKNEIISFISSLNIRKIPGIGKVLGKMLNELGIINCGDLFKHKFDLYVGFHQGSFESFMRAGLGISHCYHPEIREDQKSISLSQSFKPTENFEELDLKIKEFCNEISEQLQEKECKAKCISVSIKNYRFESKLKSETLTKYIYKSEDIYAIASKLFKELNIKEKLRLVGVRVASFMYKSYGIIECFTEKVPEEIRSAPKVKIFPQQCPVCSKTYTYTEKRMEMHVNQCLESETQSANSKPQKKLKSSAQTITLDHFFKRK